MRVLLDANVILVYHELLHKIERRSAYEHTTGQHAALNLGTRGGLFWEHDGCV